MIRLDDRIRPPDVVLALAGDSRVACCLIASMTSSRHSLYSAGRPRSLAPLLQAWQSTGTACPSANSDRTEPASSRHRTESLLSADLGGRCSSVIGRFSPTQWRHQSSVALEPVICPRSAVEPSGARWQFSRRHSVVRILIASALP